MKTKGNGQRLMNIGYALLWLVLIEGCVSPAVNSTKTEPASITPPKPASKNLSKPENGVAYFLPKVELQLTAILTNVPNPNNMVMYYATNTFISNSLSGVITSISTNLDKNGNPISVTSTFWQQVTNTTVSITTVPSTNTVYVISITPTIIPDPNALYLLNIAPDKWKASSDNFNFQVDSNGFLESLNATNADQTPQIVSELAQAAVEIAMAPGLPAAPPPPGPRPLLPPPTLVKPLPGRVDLIFDPTSDGSLQAANSYLINKFVANPANDLITAQAICPIQLGATFNGGSLIGNSSDNYLTNYSNPDSGVVYRPLMPYFLTVTNFLGQSGTNYLQYLVMSPNRAPLFSLSVERAVLVTRTTSISFNSGFLNTVNYSNPSQLAAALGLPLTVVGEIFSSVTNVLQLRFNIASSQNNIATQQTDLVNQETALNNATTNLLQSVQSLNQFRSMEATNVSQK